MKPEKVIFFVPLVLIFLSGFVTADRLPNQTPETQVFTVDTIIDVTGIISDAADLDGFITTNETHDGILRRREVVAEVFFSDSLRTSGGKINENRGFSWDSRGKSRKSDNLKAEKVMTYSGTGGGHLLGDESYSLEVMGNYSRGVSRVMCVFAEDRHALYPAFANDVKAESRLVNFNSGQVSTKGEVRAISSSNSTPAGLAYQVAVTPDNGVPALGTVKTEFSGDIMEARLSNRSISNWNKTAVTNAWKDRDTVSGEIRNLQKILDYESGMKV
ncbi:MAG: hypothetical protein LUQ07_06170 [Methanospirillum sp.]|nr:hypothetical protein [Methanospirillum sp.]